MKSNNKKNERVVGAHVSTQGGFICAIERGKEIGINGIQIFGASPVRWQATTPSKKDADAFRISCEQNGIQKVFLHAPYLINVCSPKETLRVASKQLLARHASIAVALGASGVIFHIGSRGDMEKKASIAIVIDVVKEILSTVPDSILIMENNAGAGNLVGDSIEELAQIYTGVKNERFGICVDTAHAFASGMLPSFEKKNIDAFVKEFDAKIGIDSIRALHIHDSKVSANTKKDRHENIGEGFIGAEGIGNFINHPKLRYISIILEVPGFNGGGPDKKNVDIIKYLISNK
jgi:deoxyribonuclease-4